MKYRCVIWKNPDTVNIPPDMDRNEFNTEQQNAKTDFENNYKSQVNEIQRLKDFDAELSYNDFKNKIDGQTVTWSNVDMVDMNDCYYLFIEVD